MNFDQFKEKYANKLNKLGATMPDEDRLAEIYIGLVIFTEWQAGEIAKANAAVKKENDKLAKKIAQPNKKIYTGGMH